jgi:RND family efflux transporter MFP subunit
MTEQRHAALGIHADHLDPHHHPRKGPILRRARLIGLGVLAALILGAFATIAWRVVHARALADAVAEQSRIYVITTHPKVGGDSDPLTLPGTLQGMIEVPIYARSSGYVAHIHKDIGARVAKGEVLADIDAPDLDEQLAQAIAARNQAASSLELAKTSAERWEALRQKDVVSQQEYNERTSAYTQARANLAAAEANVKRLQDLTNFKNIVAPFAGIVTHRNIEVGDLIDAGTGGGRALFTVSQVDPLRLYVYVPQAFAQRVRIGDAVKIRQAESGIEVATGKVVRTAGAIDTATRTLQIEVNLPNHDGKLLAGAYVQAELPIKSNGNALTVPSNVLLFRPDGVKVAVVGEGGHVQLRKVTLGHDFGNSLEVLDGVQAADNLVVNPADSLADGDVVTVAQQQTKEPKAGDAKGNEKQANGKAA